MIYSKWLLKNRSIPIDSYQTFDQTKKKRPLPIYVSLCSMSLFFHANLSSVMRVMSEKKKPIEHDGVLLEVNLFPLFGQVFDRQP